MEKMPKDGGAAFIRASFIRLFPIRMTKKEFPMKGSEILAHVDHTLLRPTASWEEIKTLLQEAKNCHTASVCLPAAYVAPAYQACGGDVPIGTVVGFPLGYDTAETKLSAARQAINHGAAEVDAVVNLTDVKNGAFDNRKTLLKVPRLGEKTYEQAAGFLRIHGGSEPLDASAVHPEAYPVVAKMLADKQLAAADLIGNREKIRQIKPADYTTAQFGLPTILDILAELEKPGRDPRGEFQTATFAEGVHEISDLQPGMILEGVVSNVANFGAFVDIGVHQDGLVHISALADRYVEDPRDIVKAGDVVKVKVLEVDAARKRIALTMRLADEPGSERKPTRDNNRPARPQQRQEKPANTAMADAFAKMKR